MIYPTLGRYWVRAIKKYLPRFLLVLTTVLALCVLWELISSAGIVPKYLFPPPSRVSVTLIELIMSGTLVKEYIRTLVRVLIGFTLGALTGLLVGITLSLRDVVKDVLYPLLAFLAVTPTVALIPLLIVWVGINEFLPITAVFICSSIPVIYNTVSGMRSVDPEMVGVARTLGAGTPKVVFTIMLPQALPSVFSALKIEAIMAWKTCFVAEMLAMSSGLGYLMVVAQSALRVDVLLAALLVLSTSTYFFHFLFERLELRVLKKWGLVA